MSDSRGHDRRKGRIRGRLARAAVALPLCFTLTSCENFERYAPEAASIFGAVLTTAAAVAAIQFAPEYYTEVNILMNTLTSSATAMVATWAEYRAEEKALEELERLEAEIAAEELAMAGGTSSGADPPGDWTNAADADGGGTWSNAAYSNPPPADEPWGDRYRDVQTRSDARLAIDVALARRATDGSVTPLADGDVLHDGRDGEHSADSLQVFVRPLQASYVYVIGIDAVGRVQPLYPAREFEGQNFIESGHGIALPATDSGYGLDEYRGIQQIYFRVSRERDAELERQLQIFASTELPTPTKPDRVTEPTIIEGPALQSRGLTGIRRNTRVRISDDFTLEAQRIAGSDELVATRWFEHR